MRLSIVARVFNAEVTIREFLGRVDAIRSFDQIEVVLVNDGSTDRSLAEALAFPSDKAQVRILDLSRTFGLDRALFTGLECATGELMVLADTKSPNSLDSLDALYSTLRDAAADLASGPTDTIHLMTRRFALAVLAHHDQDLSLADTFARCGFHQASSTLKRKGPALHSIFYAGAILWIGVAVLFPLHVASGPIIAALIAAGGTLLSLGVVAIYLDKAIIEAKRRPDAIVRAIFRGGREHANV